MSDSNYTRLGYVAESTFGTTPSSALQLLRRTGGAITSKRTHVSSGEIQANLRGGKPVRTYEWCEGSINVEWSGRSMDDLIPQMLMADWTSSIIVDGTTQKSLTIEDQFIDADVSPNQYITYRGCRMSALSLQFNTGALVTGSFSVLGKSGTQGTSSAGTGGPTAATTAGPFNTVDMITTMSENSTAIAQVSSVTLNFARNLRRKHGLGNLNPFDIGVGKLMVTGTMKQYFHDARLYAEWANFSDSSLQIKMDDSSGAGGGHTYQIDIAKMKYIGDPVVDVPGPDSDCFVTVNFEAYALVSDAYLVKFTRDYP